MISVHPDMSGVAKYIGAVEGLLQAVEDPRFEGDFVEHMMDSVENSFMVESIAAKNTGDARISHVFEWGERQGQISDTPLFKVTRSGGVDARSMSYMFLPSTRYVPLPNPSRYGFNPEKLQYLRRHVFQLKALVMETKSTVDISPVGSRRLFIPSAKAKNGYYMTTKTVSINPGGPSSTGGFAAWWNQWFTARAPHVVSEEVQKTESWLVSTGAKYVRYAAGTVIGGEKVGGRFASGRTVTAGYVDAEAKKVKRRVLAESSALFDRDAWEAQWDE